MKLLLLTTAYPILLLFPIHCVIITYVPVHWTAVCIICYDVLHFKNEIDIQDSLLNSLITYLSYRTHDIIGEQGDTECTLLDDAS